jgi:hypothetical protein
MNLPAKVDRRDEKKEKRNERWEPRRFAPPLRRRTCEVFPLLLNVVRAKAGPVDNPDSVSILLLENFRFCA